MPAGPTASSPLPASTAAASPGTAGEAAAALARASGALWLATLSLMTAFMQTPAPAHRYLLARRVAGNLETLAGQDCFDGGCRERFARLARRWQERAAQFAPQPARPARFALADFLF